MSISCLTQAHIQKIELKMGKRKLELQKWKNDVGQRIEEKLKVNHEKSACVTEVVKHVSSMGEYSVQLTNSRMLVVNLSNRTCTF